MKIAITGGTGFVGRHLARELLKRGHQLVLLSRGENAGADEFEDNPDVTLATAPVEDTVAMVKAIRGCQAVYHLVGINRERGKQTFHEVHVTGTRNVASAMRQAEIKRVIFVSFLQARSNTESPYHVSKWQAEQIISDDRFDFTIFRPGVIYGEGDQFLTHLKRSLNTLPFFGLVGFRPKPLAPIYVEDFALTLAACLDRDDTIGKTYAVVGPEKLTMAEIVDLAADTIDIIPSKIPLPIFIHRISSLLMEMFMDAPLVTSAQVTMLSEDLSEPLEPCDPLPPEFHPRTRFLTRQQQEAKIDG